MSQPRGAESFRSRVSRLRSGCPHAMAVWHKAIFMAQVIWFYGCQS